MNLKFTPKHIDCPRCTLFEVVTAIEILTIAYPVLNNASLERTAMKINPLNYSVVYCLFK
ncbi:hypothetical protein D5S10_21995 [Pseudomonas savastanoi]|uniref:Uncharacterized protein n=2 Tax=Pseudomonas syringae group TaxID=136849 RepID=A0A3M5JI63_PSEA0|nr:hypothetical protein D5S10_21995 [Pseudomonas savastanoi]RMP00217.1 hypothetical protein ALQ30_200762 [Pseudomonas syringae pv. persicae]RMT22873.1 hypothetical protein ALP52_02857 [Pseudomonas amygdali pv. mori]